MSYTHTADFLSHSSISLSQICPIPKFSDLGSYLPIEHAGICGKILQRFIVDVVSPHGRISFVAMRNVGPHLKETEKIKTKNKLKKGRK